MDFRCDHIVPQQNVSTLIINKNEDDVCLEVKFDNFNKASQQLVSLIGSWLTRTTSLVPGGVVVFFAGYAYLSDLAAKGAFKGLKNHFVEPKSSADVETILLNFTNSISVNVISI
jgi:Rad3-related DNA helicase